MLNDRDIQSLAGRLGALKQDVAFLLDGETVYYATQPLKPPIAPKSAIVDLIQGVYEKYPDQARRIVRNRIYTTVKEPTLMCTQMVKVAAKRLSTGIVPSSAQMPADRLTLIQINERDQTSLVSTLNRDMGDIMAPGPDFPQSHQDFMKLALRIAGQVSFPNRKIASILVSQDPKTNQRTILAAGMNTSSRNKTLHAEVNMIQSYYRTTGQIIPANSWIYTSLKPCRMCASMIWHCSSDRQSLEVFYGENDPGPHARDLVLPPLNLKAFPF